MTRGGMQLIFQLIFTSSGIVFLPSVPLSGSQSIICLYHSLSKHISITPRSRTDCLLACPFDLTRSLPHVLRMHLGVWHRQKFSQCWTNIINSLHKHYVKGASYPPYSECLELYLQNSFNFYNKSAKIHYLHFICEDPLAQQAEPITC